MKNYACKRRAMLAYFKNNLLFSTILFFIAIGSGMIIFRTEKLVIYPHRQVFFTLLYNNFLVCLTIMIAGILSFGILGNFVLFANGVIVGRIIIGVFSLYGMKPLLHYLAPHFIFEISALIIATVISQETYKFFYNLRHVDIKIIYLRYDLGAFLIMNILLVVAALIESNL